MRIRTKTAIFVGIMFAALTSYSPVSSAEVSVNIGIGLPLPHVVIHEPPAVVVIPGTYVYFVPDAGPAVDIFFYHGYWYQPHEGRWYRARDYNGPWRNIRKARVPHELRGLPPDFRHAVRHHERIRHVDLKKNWRTWERKRHWDRHDYGHKGPDVHKGRRWESSPGRHDYRTEKRVPDGRKRESRPVRYNYEQETREDRSSSRESNPIRYDGKEEHGLKKPH